MTAWYVFITITGQTIFVCSLIIHFSAFSVCRTPVRFFVSDAGRERKNLKISFRDLKSAEDNEQNLSDCVVYCFSLHRTICPQKRRAFFSLSSHEPLPYCWLFFALTSPVMAQPKICWLQRWGMAVRYKITATIIKPGNPPVFWTRYSGNKMTRAECEKMLSIPKEPGRSFGDKIKVQNFRCVTATEEKVWKYYAVITVKEICDNIRPVSIRWLAIVTWNANDNLLTLRRNFIRAWLPGFFYYGI